MLRAFATLLSNSSFVILRDWWLSPESRYPIDAFACVNEYPLLPIVTAENCSMKLEEMRGKYLKQLTSMSGLATSRK